eukprot:jgi/Chrpa1/9379/Chrysochromulina_OHIO_Genome00020047-RA
MHHCDASETWYRLAKEAAAERDWEAVLLSGAPVMQPDVLQTLLPALRRAAAVLYKGMVESANEFGRDEYAISQSLTGLEHVMCYGPGVTLAVLQSIGCVIGCVIRLSEDMLPLQPLLVRAANVAGWSVSIQPLQATCSAASSSVALFDIGVSGPTAVQMAQAAALTAAGVSRFWPLSVEVWALVVQSSAADGNLLHVLRPDCTRLGIDMQPLREALEGGHALAASVRLECTGRTGLCNPCRLVCWRPADSAPQTRAQSDTPTVECASSCCTREGTADAVVYWAELEVAPGQWITRAPEAWQQLLLHSRGAEGAYVSPAGLREPQAALPVRPVAVTQGGTVEIYATVGPQGVRVDRIVSSDAAAAAATTPSMPATTPSMPATTPSMPATTPSLPATMLPAWTALMMNDAARAHAYATALKYAMGTHAAAGRRHVTVLDVGAGVGLLSLLAARAAAGAGLAADIYAVERDASLARIALATVEANRVHLPPAVRVHVLHAEVAALAVQDESESGDGCAESGDACAENGDGTLHAACALPQLVLPERAHVLVHEIFGDDPFSEGVLPTLRHATASLLDPECGVVLPCRVTVYAALVAALPGSSSVVERAALLVPSGGTGTQARDLSLLDTLAPHKASIDLRALRTSPLISAPVELVTVDLATMLSMTTSGAMDALCSGSVTTRRIRSAPASEPHAVATWFSAAFGSAGDGASFSSSPSSTTHWRQMMHFPRPLGFSSRCSPACETDAAASRLSHVLKRPKAATDVEACWTIRWALLEEEMLITALSACAES